MARGHRRLAISAALVTLSDSATDQTLIGRSSRPLSITTMTSSILAPFNLPKGKNILVTDELAAPADFIIYESVTSLFKNADKSSGSPAALVLSTSLDLNRWKSVSLKYVCNINPFLLQVLILKRCWYRASI